MELKRVLSFVLAAAVTSATLASCGNRIQDNEELKRNYQTEQDASSSDSAPDDTVVTTYDEQQITANTVKYTEYSKTYQAETGTLTGGAKIAKTRKGYKGTGYVTGLNTENDGWELTFELSESQYYNITLSVASDAAVKNNLLVNGVSQGDFAVSGKGTFENVTFENVYIEKGYAKISVLPTAGNVDIDLVTVKASKDINDLDLTLKGAQLSNKNADYNAKALYQYLCGSFGKNILLGQHDTVGSIAETEKIYETTGKYPAIRFGDLMPFTEDMIIGENEIEYAKNWAENGGIVSYMWHWTDPMGSGEYYSDKTDFDITKAVTKEKISSLSLEEIKALQKEGKVSEECVAIVEDIDKISEKLKELQDAGVAVLWRPLHEASNGYFWWGKDEDAYKWLWKLLYYRQTNYHKLNNLIWVWSAQNASWYVGDDLCDVLSVDIYDKGNLSGQINRLLFLYKMCKTKPVAMSECGNFPSAQNIADEKAMWSYIGQWGGNFLMNDDGTLNEEYNTQENLIEFYNNNITITRDELPDLKAAAQKLESDSKADETASSKTSDDSSKAEKDTSSSKASDEKSSKAE